MVSFFLSFLELNLKNNSLDGEYGHTLTISTLLKWVFRGMKLKHVDLQKSIAHHESNQTCILPQKTQQSLCDRRKSNWHQTNTHVCSEALM